MKFKTAMKWLRAGKKVRRKGWKEHSYLNIGRNECLCYQNKEPAKIHLNQIEADDWELYKNETEIVELLAQAKYSMIKSQKLIKEAEVLFNL